MASETVPTIHAAATAVRVNPSSGGVGARTLVKRSQASIKDRRTADAVSPVGRNP